MNNMRSYKRRRKTGPLLIILLAFSVAFGGYFTFKNLIGKKISMVDKSAPIANVNDATTPLENQVKKSKYSEDAIFRVKYFYACGHQEEEETKIPLSFVSKTLEEIIGENPNYEFYDCTYDLINANVIIQSQCDNHYIIKLIDDKLYVYYKKDPNIIERQIDININELYEEDIEILKNGIEVGSKTELLEFLEDFSS